MTGTLLAAGLRPGTGRAACGRRAAASEVSVGGKTSTVVGCRGVDCGGDGKPWAAQRSLWRARHVVVDQDGLLGVVVALLCGVICELDELLFCCGVARTVYDLATFLVHVYVLLFVTMAVIRPYYNLRNQQPRPFYNIFTDSYDTIIYIVTNKKST